MKLELYIAEFEKFCEIANSYFTKLNNMYFDDELEKNIEVVKDAKQYSQFVVTANKRPTIIISYNWFVYMSGMMSEIAEKAKKEFSNEEFQTKKRILEDFMKKNLAGEILHGMIHQYCYINNISDMTRYKHHSKKYNSIAKKHNLLVIRERKKDEFMYFGNTNNFEDTVIIECADIVNIKG